MKKENFASRWNEINIKLPMKKNERGLIVFIRNPEKGKVKTRLANSVGDDQALKIYKSLLNHTRKVVEAVDCKRFLFYSVRIHEKDGWSDNHFDKYLQKGDELGIRMQNAFKTLFDNGIEKAVIVGSDIARLSPEIIENAFQSLDKTDFVMGKALDGGYYLLGMKSPTPSLFKNMVWSTSKVAEETIHRIHQLGKCVSLVESLSDIDFIEDWEQWGWEV